MNTRNVGLGLALFSLTTVGTLLALAQPVGQPAGQVQGKRDNDVEKEDDEDAITLDKAPEAVRTAAIKLAGDAKHVTKVIKEEDDEGVVTYEVEYNEGAGAAAIKCAAIFSAAGDLMGTEKATAEATLPLAVIAALKKAYPKATLTDPQVVTRVFYEIGVVIDGKENEVKIDASGTIEGETWGGDEKDKKHGRGGHGATPGTDGWRAGFAVNKADLGANGSGTYLMLQPGHTMTYAGGDVTLVVTVLDETRLVDGVTTRVVEERESKAGALVEVSRNFFALDPKTGDAYYFGEEVAIYEGGKIAKHEGEWLSGKDGATFGLFIPGAAKLGDKFYQEIAPGHAMDRVEVVSVTERVETRAGVFEKVVKTQETTPLEPGMGSKWFAPGVGMISDGELKLTKIDPAPAKK